MTDDNMTPLTNNEPKIPSGKHAIQRFLKVALQLEYNDEVVEVYDLKAGVIKIRVGQGDRGPKYYRVHIVEEA